jgi:hypothetical protein
MDPHQDRAHSRNNSRNLDHPLYRSWTQLILQTSRVNAEFSATHPEDVDVQADATAGNPVNPSVISTSLITYSDILCALECPPLGFVAATKHLAVTHEFTLYVIAS